MLYYGKEVVDLAYQLRDFPEVLDILKPLGETSLASFSIVEFAPKDVLIHENSMPNELFLILEGVCEIVRISHPDDQLFARTRNNRLEFVGLSELLAPIPCLRVATVAAKTPVVALKIPAEDFLEWPTKCLTIYNRVVWNVLNKQFVLHSTFLNSVSTNSYHAVIRCLIELYDSYFYSCYREAYTGPVKIWETRQEIGIHVGRDARSVARAISRLCSEQLISIKKGKIYIDSGQYKKLLDIISV